MNKLTVNVPTGRPAVARHTLQISLNRSVPAVTEDIERSLFTYPSSSQKNRVTPTMASSTNEFGTGTRTPRGPQTRGGPAGAKIVDFGRNVDLHPRGKFNVRGVGVDGFFPPVKLRTGTSGVRFSTSAGSTRSCKSANHSSPASPLNVELAPSKTSRTAGESDRLDASSTDRDWSPTTSRSENLARTHTLQDRPGNPYNTRAAASRETLSIKESSPSPSPQAFKSGNNAPGISKSGTPDLRTGKDAAWVRSFKVKQRRNNRVKELMESKPAGLTLTSHTNMGSAVW